MLIINAIYYMSLLIAWHLDVGCNYAGSAVMHPFAFRVHAHKLGMLK